MKKSLLFLLLVLFSGCASYHNISKDGPNIFGGGFIDEKLDNNFYKIIAKTNFKPWESFDASNEIFKNRANDLCKNDFYEKFNLENTSYLHVQSYGEIKYIISQTTGYILCKDSKLSLDEAKKIVDNNKIKVVGTFR